MGDTICSIDFRTRCWKIRKFCTPLHRIRQKRAFLFECNADRRSMNDFLSGGYQSGQMGQTVNLLSSTSVVRIHLRPQRFSMRAVGFSDFWRSAQIYLQAGTA